MNPHHEITAIEATLRRFHAAHNEAPRLFTEYCGDLIAKSHVPRGEYDETCDELREQRDKREQADEAVKDCEAVIQLIATELHGIIGNPKPDFPRILQRIAHIIEQGEHTIQCDADAIWETIEELVAGASGSGDCLNSDTPPTSPTNPEPTANHENQNTAHAHPARRLPLAWGGRAA
jgi:hypothetical protein